MILVDVYPVKMRLLWVGRLFYDPHAAPHGGLLHLRRAKACDWLAASRSLVRRTSPSSIVPSAVNMNASAGSGTPSVSIAS